MASATGMGWPALAAAVEPAAPAAVLPGSAARGAFAEQGTAFDMLAAGPVDLGAPDSPRASLAHYFGAVRKGRWDNAARYLVLDPTQQARGARLARRLKAVIDATGWIDLETLSDQPHGRVDDGLPANLDEVDRSTLDGRTEPMRMMRRSDAKGSFRAFSPATVNRIDAWYAELPDRWLRDAFVGSGATFMLLPGPLALFWWQWFGLATLLLTAWFGGSPLGRATRWLLRKATERTPALGTTS